MSSEATRSEMKSSGVIVLRELLLHIAQSPETYAVDDDIAKALKSQGRVASLCYELKDGKKKGRSTTPMSLNTLKGHADQLLENGFSELDALRIAALDAINAYRDRRDAPNKRTKAGLNETVKDLEEQLNAQRAINLLLLQAVSNAIHSIKVVSKETTPATRNKKARDGIDRLRGVLSLNAPPFDQIQDAASVVSLESVRDRDGN